MVALLLQVYGAKTMPGPGKNERLDLLDLSIARGANMVQ